MLGCKVVYNVTEEVYGFRSKKKVVGIFPPEVESDRSLLPSNCELISIGEPIEVSRHTTGLEHLLVKKSPVKLVPFTQPEYVKTLLSLKTPHKELNEDVLILAGNYAVYLYNFKVNNEPGPYYSNYEFKQRLIKLLSDSKRFKGRKALIDYVKQIPHQLLR